MEGEFKQYKVPVRLGIDDVDYYPGLEAEWWTEEQWKEYRDGIPARKERDRLYIEQLRMEGRFGKTEEYTITMQYNPIFDAPSFFKPPALESYRMIFLNE